MGRRRLGKRKLKKGGVYADIETERQGEIGEARVILNP